MWELLKILISKMTILPLMYAKLWTCGWHKNNLQDFVKGKLGKLNRNVGNGFGMDGVNRYTRLYLIHIVEI